MKLIHSFGVAAILIVMGAGANAAPPPDPAKSWPGFRGHEMSGVAASKKLPEKWSKTEGLAWTMDVPGRGWSSPIVWENTVFITSAIGAKAFKQPTPGLYGNDYVAEMQKQGLPMDEIRRRLRARDNEMPEESGELRFMVYALDSKTGKVKWEREAHKSAPQGGRHRKNTYASETPFTDGKRLYVSFGQNIGLFTYALDGKLLWKKQWAPKRIYNEFGTASSPTVYDGRIYLLHDNEEESYITALDAATGAEIWRTVRPDTGLPKSSWMTPFVWKNALRTEIITTGHTFVISYDLSGKELWRIGRMPVPTASPMAAHGLLYVGAGSLGDANRPFYAVKPGASGDITLAQDAASNDFIVWSHPRASGYTPSALVYDGRVYLIHDAGILLVLDAHSGKEIYKVRAGGVGNTFSASPVGAGGRVYLLNEDGATLVVDARAATYTEVSRNELGEMSLASPAAAGDALYIRTETKLYKIGR